MTTNNQMATVQIAIQETTLLALLALRQSNEESVRRHINCHRLLPEPLETLLTIIVDIMRRLCGIASVDVRLSFA